MSDTNSPKKKTRHQKLPSIVSEDLDKGKETSESMIALDFHQNIAFPRSNGRDFLVCNLQSIHTPSNNQKKPFS